MKKCPFCGKDIQDEAIYCKHCHKDLLKNNSTKNPQKPSAKQKGRTIKIILLSLHTAIAVPAVLILLLLGLMSVWLFIAAIIVIGAVIAEWIAFFKNMKTLFIVSHFIVWIAIVAFAALVISIVLEENESDNENYEEENYETVELDVPDVISSLDRSFNGRVVYTSTATDGKNDVFLIDGYEQEVINLTNSSESEWCPKFSPDGRRIAFLSKRDDDIEFYIMDLDGRNVMQISEVATHLYCTDYEWAPDGKSIVYINTSENDPDNNGVSFLAIGDIEYRINRDAEILFSSPRHLPDGENILYRTANKIYLSSIKRNSEPELLMVGDSETSQNNNRSLLLSPDGKKVAFTLEKHRDDHLYLMSTDGTDPIFVSSLDYVGGCWSADSQELYLISDDNEFWRLTMDDPENPVISSIYSLDEPEGSFACSPDGKYIIYDSDDGEDEIMILFNTINGSFQGLAFGQVGGIDFSY